MTNNKIKIRGWKTNVESDAITFERGDWFLVADYNALRDYAKKYLADGCDETAAIAYAAKDLLLFWNREGVPVGRESVTFRNMLYAIVEAIKNN